MFPFLTHHARARGHTDAYTYAPSSPTPTSLQVAPTGMIFIPCRNGWSHRPDEFASPEDITNGVRVLALTMAALGEQGGTAGAAHSEL
jgi:acetylornithine deacetylase/succinyl-diaminopimelate desuccinylase-like protein